MPADSVSVNPAQVRAARLRVRSDLERGRTPDPRMLKIAEAKPIQTGSGRAGTGRRRVTTYVLPPEGSEDVSPMLGQTPIEDLDLTVRTYNSLTRIGVDNVDRLLTKPDAEGRIALHVLVDEDGPHGLDQAAFDELLAKLREMGFRIVQEATQSEGSRPPVRP